MTARHEPLPADHEAGHVAHRMTARAAELLSERVPFVHATVVRAQSPTSAAPRR